VELSVEELEERIAPFKTAEQPKLSQLFRWMSRCRTPEVRHLGPFRAWLPSSHTLRHSQNGK